MDGFVIGIDVSGIMVESAQKNHKAGNLEFSKQL